MKKYLLALILLCFASNAWALGGLTNATGITATPGGTGTGNGITSLTATSPNLVFSPATCTTGACTGSIIDLINAQVGTSYAILSADMGKTVTTTNAASIAVSIASAATAGFTAGKSFTLINLGAGTATLTPTTSTINGQSSLVLLQYQSAYIISDGTNYIAFLGTNTAAGSGTVTTFSCVTANGVSCSVANATTTPAATFTLAAITPTTVYATAAVVGGSVALSVSGGAIATNAALGNHFRVTPAHSASTTMSAPSNPIDGQKITYELVQDGTGSGTISWNAVFNFGTSGSPTLTTTANKRDIVGFVYSSDKVNWLYLGSQLNF